MGVGQMIIQRQVGNKFEIIQQRNRKFDESLT